MILLCFVIGTPFLGSSSRSLPPSPQRTPSRKHSLALVNPFSLCPEMLEEVQKSPSEASEHVHILLEQVKYLVFSLSKDCISFSCRLCSVPLMNHLWTPQKKLDNTCIHICPTKNELRRLI